MSAECHNLRFGFAVDHSLGFPLSDKFFFCSCTCNPSLCTMFLDSFVLDIQHLLSENYPHLVDSIAHQPLHVKTVINQLRFVEYTSRCKHHCRREICRNCFNFATLFNRNYFQCGRHSIQSNAAYHCRQGSFASVCRFVGQDCVDFTIGQASLVKTQILAEVVGEKHILRSMLKLFPLAVITDFFFVLFMKHLSLQTIADCKCGKCLLV